MGTFNVLLTSVGRRSYIVRYFQQALAGRGQVIVTNVYESQGTAAADVAYIVPPSHEEKYIPEILDICERHQIKMVLSLHDLDMYILSYHAEKLRQAGVITVLPSAKLGKIALDKMSTYRYMKKNGFATPWTTTSLDSAFRALRVGDLGFPVILKARMGFGSLGYRICNDAYELTHQYELARRQISRSQIPHFIDSKPEESVIIQQSIHGQEFCVDLVNDLEGNYQTCFICLVHRMRSGETDLVTTVRNNKIETLVSQLSGLFDHPGLMGVDMILNRGQLFIIDLNPRFTGDYPFHHVSGANVPAALVAWAMGEPVDPAWLEPRPGFRGFKDLVPITFTEEHIHIDKPAERAPT